MCLNAQLWLIDGTERKGMGSSTRNCVIHNEERFSCWIIKFFLISNQRPQGKIWVRNLALGTSHWSLFFPRREVIGNCQRDGHTSQSSLVSHSSKGPTRRRLWSWSSHLPQPNCWGFGWFHSFCSHEARRKPVFSPWPLNDTCQSWRLWDLHSLEN